MSVCILMAPVVVASWPVFASAVLGAAASLGYVAGEELAAKRPVKQASERKISLSVPNSEVITDSLGRGQKITVEKDGVLATFSRDERGGAALHVSGDRYEESVLRKMGEELSQRVVQKYVYQHLMGELAARDFVVVEESLEVGQAIRVKVRKWEN